jgi:hypothetical protein
LCPRTGRRSHAHKYASFFLLSSFSVLHSPFFILHSSFFILYRFFSLLFVDNITTAHTTTMSTFHTSTRPLVANDNEDPQLAVLVRIANAFEKQVSQKPDAVSTWVSPLVVGVVVCVVTAVLTWYLTTYHSKPKTTTLTPDSADPRPQPEDEGGKDSPGPRAGQSNPAESSTTVLGDDATLAGKGKGKGKNPKTDQKKKNRQMGSAVQTRASRQNGN